MILPDKGYSISMPPDMLFKSLSSFKEYSIDICSKTYSKPEAYIASEFDQDLLPTDRQFIVGEKEPGENSPNDRNYVNGPLCHGVSYTFFVRAYPFPKVQVRMI